MVCRQRESRQSVDTSQLVNHQHDAQFNIEEASIEEHRKALDSGQITSVELVISYLNRIAICEMRLGLNAFTVFNDNVIKEAAASDARRTQGLPPRPLEGIPYTIKDSYRVAGMTATNGSPALADLWSDGDSAIAQKLRDAGAILVGKTNMPPMAAGGMQRGLYGRAESPYDSRYLTAAFSSGSSNGAATSVTCSMAVFGIGSETVSSGRSPASNNALICYTPSKGILSCRGLWPLYVTCDVPVPYSRSVSDMLTILDIIATEDSETKGDFIRDQPHIAIPKQSPVDYQALNITDAFKGKRVGVPKMYIGLIDSDPHAKPVYVSPEVIALWQETEKELQKLGAEVVYTDFPLVTNYENDSKSGEANNVDGQPSNWNSLERGYLVAKAWDEFLQQNKCPNIKSLADLNDSAMLFPKPKGYLPDTFLEVRNWIDYAGLPALLQDSKHESIHDIPGMKQALHALEAQRKRDLEDWMDSLKLDVIAFPAQGDVGLADLEFNLDSARHSLRNGVKYSNGNRAIRHLGVPTVSVPMGKMKEKGMPVNITFAGKAYHDTELLKYAYSFEQATKKRSVPWNTSKLETDIIKTHAPLSTSASDLNLESLKLEVGTGSCKGTYAIHAYGTISALPSDTSVVIYVDGKLHLTKDLKERVLDVEFEYKPYRRECLGWDLKPLKPRKVMVIIAVKVEGVISTAQLQWVECGENSR